MPESKFVADVRAFHEKFGVPVGAKPALLTADAWKFRENFLIEELSETRAAHARGDLAEFADGLVDLIYVAVGTALWAGLDLDAHWAEVQRANMAKETGGTRHKHDIRKPPGWVGPDHLKVLLDTVARS